MSDHLTVYLLGQLFFSTGVRRAAAKFLLRQIRAGMKLAGEVDRVVLAAAEELGQEVGDAVRQICRELGFCD
jgi:hypothetical protein